MTGVRYPRSLVESLLVKGEFPESYRIISRRHVGSPLGTRPVDSRFVSRSGGYTVLYVLTLLDLRGDGCTRIGAPTDVVQARNHAARRAFGKAIHAEHEDVDGLLYASRLTGEDAYAVYDRGVGKLVVGESGRLGEHLALPSVLERYGIGLVL